MHMHSDPGTSAFHPVVSKFSIRTEKMVPIEHIRGGNKKKTSPELNSSKLGSKLLSNIKGALKSSRKRVVSGRENPVSLLADEGTDNENDDGSDNSLVGSAAFGVGNVEDRGEEFTLEMSQTYYRGSSDMFSDSDLDEDIIEPILGQYHLLNEKQHQHPPSIDLPSVEVVSDGITGASLTGLYTSEGLPQASVETPDSTEHELQLRPPSAEVTHHTEDIPAEVESPACHFPIDDHKLENVTTDSIVFPLQIAYKSPKSSSSPSHSNKSFSPHSHTTTSGDSQSDYEVRETNRRSSQTRNCEEVVVDLDGNVTIYSSSTNSSNYHVHSPKIREGAMPGERFFAEGATISEGDDLNISGLSLSPNESQKRDIMVQLLQFPTSSSPHPRTHSPHTVSSASISNTSSSGSEMKKPLKFVAIRKGSDCPKGIMGAIIKPRISKGAGQRPPIQTFTSYQKPPQSPRKDVLRGGMRTPTRTPPPARESTTPCSPPVIVDGPVRGDLNSRTKKPHGIRSSRGGLTLRFPSSEVLYQQSETNSNTLSEMVVTADSANSGAQEVIPTCFVRDMVSLSHVKLTKSIVVTPDRVKAADPQHEVDRQKKNTQDSKKQNVAMISPDRQS
jgi:hypothetical protein